MYKGRRPLSDIDREKELRDPATVARLIGIPWCAIETLMEAFIDALVYHECRFKSRVIDPATCATMTGARSYVLETFLPVMLEIYSNPDDPSYCTAVTRVLRSVEQAERVNPTLYDMYAKAITVVALHRRRTDTLSAASLSTALPVR